MPLVINIKYFKLMVLHLRYIIINFFQENIFKKIIKFTNIHISYSTYCIFELLWPYGLHLY